MFATTLIHEIVHAYYMFLGNSSLRGKEPMWHPGGLKNELGYCWEELILGGICNPLFGTLHNCDALFSVQTWMWHPGDTKGAEVAHEMLKTFNEGEGGVEVRRIRLDPDFKDLVSHEWRGVEYYGAYVPGMNFICIVDGIPIGWIAGWFRESRWEQLRKDWKLILWQYGEGTRRPWAPRLGLRWSLGYQKDAYGQQKMFESSL
jgi:hypothetical protein